MRGMDDGPWTGLGTLGWFLGVWVVMMAAMMFPSVAPTVALYSRMTRQRSPLSPLAVRRGLPRHVGRASACSRSRSRVPVASVAGDVLAWDRAGRWVAGATLVVAAVYELTPLKDVCLGKCRSPLGLPARLVARRPVGRAADGCEERRLVRRLLLGADGVAVRAGRHEHRLDGVRRRADRGREDPPVAPRRDLRDGRGPARARRAAARRARRDPGPHDPGDDRCRRWGSVALVGLPLV